MPAFTRRQYAGAAASTTITAGINTVDTTCTLAATTGWPSTGGVPFYVVIDPGTSAEEKCSATISGSTLTLTRGQDDTSASSHSAGATIYPVFTANDADEANALVAKLTTKGDILATDGSALNRLAVGTNDYALLADSAATNGVAWKQIPAAGLASNSVTAAKLASNSVETAKILNANVTADKLATGSVTTAKIADLNVTGAKLANVTVSTKTGSYTLVAADRNTRIAMNSASSTSITVNSSLFSAGDVVYIHNIGAGTCTVTAGTATVNTEGDLELAQWGGGTLYFTSASSAIFFRYGGVATPETSPYHYEGSLYQYDIFTESGTWDAPVTSADVFVVGGGGGTGINSIVGGPGGGAGGVRAWIACSFTIGNSYTVSIGAAGVCGATATNGGASSITNNGTTISASGGGRGTSPSGGAAAAGGSGGGTTGAIGTVGTGNAGGYTPAEGCNGGYRWNTVGYGGHGGGGGGANQTAGGAGGKRGVGGYALGFATGVTPIGNPDFGGWGGTGYEMDTDISAAPIFAGLGRYQFGGAHVQTFSVACGGCGSGYTGMTNAGNSFAMQNFGGGMGGGYVNGGYAANAVDAQTYGSGGSSGISAQGRPKSGLVIVRYAL